VYCRNISGVKTPAIFPYQSNGRFFLFHRENPPAKTRECHFDCYRSGSRANVPGSFAACKGQPGKAERADRGFGHGGVIGAGSGAVTVEMALAGFRGRVFAVEREEAAVNLIRENCRRFHTGNVTAIHGEAPGILTELPSPNAVFIGGSGGSENLKGIIAAARSKNPHARIVATAITIETASTLLAALPAASLFQISAAVGQRAGSSHLLIAQNPVMIISDSGKEV
jgi:precorrin-6Y C5,15-methyltransferase (decarboxylating) CbiT subunit